MPIRLELVGGPLDGQVQDLAFRSPPPELRLATPVPLRALRHRRHMMRQTGRPLPLLRYVFDGRRDRVSLYLYKGCV